jgi:hypothetical protein
MMLRVVLEVPDPVLTGRIFSVPTVARTIPGHRIADLMAQMGHIINAIHSTVPEELWPEILCEIDGPVAADMPADEFEDWGDAEDEYDPVESAQADEDCWIQRAGRG